VTVFYDAATWQNIPEGADACLYVDGEFAVPADEWHRFGRTRGITVLGGVAAALSAGCIDFELYNAAFDDPGRLQDWVAGRRGMNCRARVYVARENFAKAHALVGAEPNVLWWVPTLDGHELTADELAASVLAEAHVTIPLERLWAQQVWGGVEAKVDKSVLFGTW